MKFLILSFAITAASCLLMTVQAADHAKKEGQGMVRHMVAFKFKSTATEQDIKHIESEFLALKAKIPQIAGFEWGINNSPENLNKGCTHGYLLSFKSDKDRDVYLTHPAHVAFGGLVKPLLDDVFVLDFRSRE